MKSPEQKTLRWALLAGLVMVLAVASTGCARTVAVETGYGGGYVRPGVVVRPGYVRPGVVVRRQPVYVQRPGVVVRRPGVVVRRPGVVVRRPGVVVRQPGVRVVGPRGGSITIR